MPDPLRVICDIYNAFRFAHSITITARLAKTFRVHILYTDSETYSFSILCLIDGWSFGVNDAQFLDFVPLTENPASIRISGKAEIYFAGFVSRDLDYTQAFPLSTNVTFSCPEGGSFEIYHKIHNITKA